MNVIKIVISGPQGTGKSRLAAWLIARLPDVQFLDEVEEVVVLSTNHEIDETQDGLDFEEEGRIRP